MIYILYIYINLKHSKDVILNVPRPNTLYKYLIWQLKVYSLLIVSDNSRVYVIPVAPHYPHTMTHEINYLRGLFR